MAARVSCHAGALDELVEKPRVLQSKPCRVQGNAADGLKVFENHAYEIRQHGEPSEEGHKRLGQLGIAQAKPANPSQSTLVPVIGEFVQRLHLESLQQAELIRRVSQHRA